MAAPVGAYTRAAQRSIYVDGLQGCCEAAANAITGRTASTRGAPGKPNGGLNSLASNQDTDSLTSPNGNSFDPEMTIQMIKVMGVHAA